MNEREIVQWLYKMNVLNVRKQPIDRLSYIRIQMNGINNIDLWVVPCNNAQCLTDALKTSAKAFTAMASDKNEPA
ncbi:hypothetical protein HW05_07895 [Pseudomonas aeruginosa]|nr:hypothetical protein HW05_07895 [Pseudomonas aeruginosa]